MNHLTRTHYVAYIDGVKIMYNPKHKETIFILPSAMYGLPFMEWKRLHAPELKQFYRAHRARP
jgi:hypothetical protein